MSKTTKQKENLDKKQAEDAGIGTGTGTGVEGKAPGKALGSDAYLQGRRSLAYELVESGGVAESRLGLEILFLLPDYFVNFYSDLFHQAFRVSGGSVMGAKDTEGLEKASGATGMVLGSETKLQAMGGGKRWKNTPMAITNEKALAAKAFLDKKLREAIEDTMKIQEMDRLKGKNEGHGGHGDSDARSGTRGLSGSKADRCYGVVGKKEGGNENGWGRCGRFFKAEWSYCPNCGTSTEWSLRQAEVQADRWNEHGERV